MWGNFWKNVWWRPWCKIILVRYFCCRSLQSNIGRWLTTVAELKDRNQSVPFPDINTASHCSHNARFFTTLDLNQTHYQISLSHVLASYHLVYRLVPIPIHEDCYVGATGEQVLTRILDSLFHYINFETLYHYLDDLVICSEDFESHVTRVEK